MIARSSISQLDAIAEFFSLFISQFNFAFDFDDWDRNDLTEFSEASNFSVLNKGPYFLRSVFDRCVGLSYLRRFGDILPPRLRTFVVGYDVCVELSRLEEVYCDVKSSSDVNEGCDFLFCDLGGGINICSDLCLLPGVCLTLSLCLSFFLLIFSLFLFLLVVSSGYLCTVY